MAEESEKTVKVEPTSSEETAVNGTSNGVDPSVAESDEYKKCIEHGVAPKIAEMFVDLCKSIDLKFSDVEDRTFFQLKNLKEVHAKHVMDAFKQANLLGVVNRVSYFGVCLKAFVNRLRNDGEATALSSPVVRGPPYEKLKALLERTGYPLEVNVGHRRYGPPPGSDDHAPAGGGLYVGNIPRTIFEDELVELFEPEGQLFEVRLMMHSDTMLNKTFAFISYMNKEVATAAAKKLDGHSLHGNRLRVNVSLPNLRIFVGNVPKQKSKEEILEAFNGFAENVSEVVVYPPQDPQLKNRGFCFVQFSDHRSAASAKRALGSGKQELFERTVTVEWAEMAPEVDPEAQSKVKVVYVTNLADSTTEEKLKELFAAHGEIESIKKIKNYAFVHFNEREPALKAIEALKETELDGRRIMCQLARPPMSQEQKDQMQRMRERRGRGGRGDWRGAGPPRGRGRGRGYGPPAPYGGPPGGPPPPPPPSYGGYGYDQGYAGYSDPYYGGYDQSYSGYAGYGSDPNGYGYGYGYVGYDPNSYGYDQSGGYYGGGSYNPIGYGYGYDQSHGYAFFRMWWIRGL